MIKIQADCRNMEDHEIFNTIVANRGITTDKFDDFIHPTDDQMLPLDSMRYIDKAYRIVDNGIEDKKKFLVVFDTDTDGVTAGTIMTRYLKDCQAIVDWTINDGKAHGLIGQDISRFTDCDILIIVDSLDTDCSMYKEISKKGIQIIVLDHHAIVSSDYDKYITLVSSQRDYDNPALSGAGVCWKFCKYIDDENLTDYADDYVDLACTGIVADMSDMTSLENRYICDFGFDNIKNPFIKKIVGSFPFNSTAVSFSIATLINAANRVNNNTSAALAMLEDEPKQLQKYIKELKNCKDEQNEIVSDLMVGVSQQAENQKNKKVIVTFINSDANINGLIGNKLLGVYHRPLIVLKSETIDKIPYYVGSIRAVGVKDFRQMCEDAGAIANGHELSAGIKIEQSKFKTFLDTLNNELANCTFETDIQVDAQVDISDITSDLIDHIKVLDRISGQGFKPIRFLVDGVSDYTVSQMSQGKHLIVNSNGINFIKWNWTGSFEDMIENSLMCVPLKFIGTLNSGYIGRNYMSQMIVDEVEID